MQKFTKRKIQAAETRNKFFQAGLNLINQNGYEKTSIDMICDACGMSKGAFYHHFESKIGLLLEAAQHTTDILNDEVKEKTGLPVIQRLNSYINCYAETLDISGIEFIRACSTYVISADYHAEENINSITKTIQNNITQIIKDAISVGELTPDLPVDIIIEIIETFISGLHSSWCLYNGAYNVKEHAEKSGKILTLILNSYLLTK